MKGFIIAIRPAKNEDLIVTILEDRAIKNYYRFYGARHSILQVGYLIDYASEEESHFMPRLKELSHIGFPWLYRKNHLMIWQRFIQLFEVHLRDTQTLEPFYFELLLEGAKRWHKQNPKRIICEMAHHLLNFEGRLHTLDSCYICEKPLGDDIALMQALLPAHSKCIYASSLPKKKLQSFFDSGKTTWLEDEEVEYIYQLILKGF